MSKFKPEIPDPAKLRDSCLKLRGLAYLIELCGEHLSPPLDEGSAFLGMSLIMGDIHAEILGFARGVETYENHFVKQAKPTVKQKRKLVKHG